MKGKELTTMEQAGLPTNLSNLKADAPDTGGSVFLPSLSFGWAIMLQDNPNIPINHFFVEDNNIIHKIDEPVIITHVAQRNALRKLVQENGKKTYIRGAEPIEGGTNETQDDYRELLKALGDGDTDVQKGATVVLALRGEKSGKMFVCNFDMYKTIHGAFWYAVDSAKFAERKGTRLLISDWREAMKESKTGNKYPTSHKVANFIESVDLEGEILQDFAGAIRANGDQIGNWLKK